VVDTLETIYTPPQLFDMTSPVSFSNDSGFRSTHSNTPFQFPWQATSQPNGSDEYNSIPFEPNASSVSPTNIIVKQENNLNTLTPTLNCNAQLFATFPDSNDVFDLLIDDKEPTNYSCRENFDSMLRENLIATVESAGITTPDIPLAVEISTYVDAYWEYIHPHAPIFFKPGFVAHFVPEGILLGMCSLGALALGTMQHATALNIYTRAVVRDACLLISCTNFSDGIQGTVSYMMSKGCY